MCKDCEAKDAEIGRLNAAVESVCKGSFGASEALAKDNADLRTQLDTANAAAGEAVHLLKEWCDRKQWGMRGMRSDTGHLGLCSFQGGSPEECHVCGTTVRTINLLNSTTCGTSLLRDLEQVRAALSFYANEHNYNDDPSDIPGCPVPGTAPIWVDHGGKAQQALKGVSQP